MCQTSNLKSSSNRPKPRAVCNGGLWRYSRHPNYFFEWLHWWAYVCSCRQLPWAVSLIGPLLMYVFLRYPDGIPHTERASLARRGEAYRQYQNTTNLFSHGSRTIKRRINAPKRHTDSFHSERY